MCSSDQVVSADTILNVPSSAMSVVADSTITASSDSARATPVGQSCGPPASIHPIDQYRLQLYNYAIQAERLRFVQQNYGNCSGSGAGFGGGYPRWPFSMSLFQNRLINDEPKPQHSYIGLIAMAILSSPDSKLVLSDIYQYILDNYPYFRSRGPGWRNSIRHNLSLNDCFIKAGRSANGKGHYWAIHPANIDDFKKGDFRRRKAQRKVRKHMGLAVDDDGNDSPSPPPLTPPPNLWPTASPLVFPTAFPTAVSRKRQFDVASLLAPDDSPPNDRKFQQMRMARGPLNFSSEEDDECADIDVVNSTAEANISVSQRLSPRPIGPAMATPWCSSGTATNTLSHHQQLVAKYYEQLNHARTIQLYQHLQLQRRFSEINEPDMCPKIEDIDTR